MIILLFSSKIVELEEELRVVGNNLKSLEVSEEKVSILTNTASLDLKIQDFPQESLSSSHNSHNLCHFLISYFKT